MIPKPLKPLKPPNLNVNSSGSLANKMALGSRTYNGFSPSPQSGKGGLNPLGYKVRDNKAEVKRKLLAAQAKKLGGK